MPQAYAELLRVRDLLEKRFRDMQDIEFTIEDGKLYLLQTRNGKRTGFAAVRIATDMVDEGLITDEGGGRARRAGAARAAPRAGLPDAKEKADGGQGRTRSSARACPPVPAPPAGASRSRASAPSRWRRRASR